MKEVNGIQSGSLLWYPTAITNIVAKSESFITYSNEEGNIHVNSFNNTDHCVNGTNYVTCFDGTRVTNQPSENTLFCTEIPSDEMCKNKEERGYFSITPVGFYIFGGNPTGDDVQFYDDQESDTVPTVQDAAECSSQPTLSDTHISGGGAVGKNIAVQPYNMRITFYHKKVYLLCLTGVILYF